MRAAIYPLVLAMLLSGCGFKGPLYLPKSKPEVQKPVPAPQQDEKKPDPS